MSFGVRVLLTTIHSLEFQLTLFRQTASELPQVVILRAGGKIPERDMPALYQEIDCYVTASGGEGWGLPMMEVRFF